MKYARRLAAAVAIALMPCAYGIDYPVKPVRFLVTQTPGSATDLEIRLAAQELEPLWKQPVIIENRSGANGRLVYEALVRAGGDPYTFGYTTPTLTSLPFLTKDLGFSPQRDLTGVAQLTSSTAAIPIAASIPATNLKEFIAWAKANPGKANYGAQGRGSTPHLLFEMLKAATGANLVEVQFTGTPQLSLALARNDIQIGSDSLVQAIKNQKDGRVRIIAIWGPQRVPELPDVETVIESGLLPFVPQSWGGIIASSSVPKDVIAKVSTDLGPIMQAPSMADKINKASGHRVTYQNTEEFDKVLDNEYRVFGDAIKRLGIQPQ